MTQHLAIVGGGPIATYALERLAALLSSAAPDVPLTITVFDRTGQFGAGAVHSATQAETSYMNRVASQIAFAADESNSDATHLLPAGQRPTFYEWCEAAYRNTGDPRFQLQPGEVPRRYLHGIALAQMFGRYVALLRAIDHVKVELRSDEVVDISTDPQGRLRLHLAGADRRTLAADHVLLATGHSSYRPAPGSRTALLADHADTTPPALYVRKVYPLAEQLSEERIPPAATIGMLGSGLTAIDALLYLTEGRGGRFVEGAPGPGGPRLQYLPSGREPAGIVMASPSGMFTSCRPVNDKAVDGSARAHLANEHKGRFLTVEAIRTLRRNVGVPAILPHGTVRQLDFERHVFPLVLLEMACLYYETLLGRQFGRMLQVAVREPYQQFLRDAGGTSATVVRDLLAPLHLCFEAAAETLVPANASGTTPDDGLRSAFQRFLDRRDGTGASRWGHSANLLAHRFDWQGLFWPLDDGTPEDDSLWHDRLLAYMERDLLDAAQGNLRNPLKAACDGVWRDLRPVFSELLDFGGLRADSHRHFMASYFRLYVRMANGTGIEPMRKLQALIELGLVDVAIGPAAQVRPVEGLPAFRIYGPRTGAERVVHILVEARVARFDARYDEAPLYPALLKRGLVRLWVNPASDGSRPYVPGGLDLDADSHPLRTDGKVDPRITLIGAAAEGVLSFQQSAARPRSDSALLNRLARWAQDVANALEPAATAPRKEEMSTLSDAASCREGA